MARFPDDLSDEDQQLFNKANGLTDQGAYRDAIAVLDDLIARNSKYFELNMYRGFCKFKLQEYAEAILDFDLMVEAHARSSNTLYLRARCKEELAYAAEESGVEEGYRRRAISDYEIIVETDPAVSDALRNLALLYEFEGRQKLALATYLKSFKCCDTDEFVKDRIEALEAGKA